MKRTISRRKRHARKFNFEGIAACIACVGIFVFMYIAGNTFLCKYSMDGFVTNVSNGIVTVETYHNGMEWEFVDHENNYKLFDEVVLSMHDNRTDEIFDDIIVGVSKR